MSVRFCRHVLSVFLGLFLAFFSSSAAFAQAPELGRAETLNAQAIEWYKQGRYAEARGLFQEVLSIREKALGPDHPDVTNSLINLAVTHEALGEYSQAEPLYLRSLAAREKALGPDHPNVASSLNSLALVYEALGEYPKAKPLLDRALAIREKALGPDHPDVAQSLNNLADYHDTLGDYDQAEPLYRRALAIMEKVHGPDHPNVAVCLNNLAGLYDTRGDHGQAEPLYLRSLAIREKVLGPDHLQVATSLNNLAELYRAVGKHDQAEPLYVRSLAIREKALGPVHSSVALSLNNLAMLYMELGEYDRAEPLFNRSLAIREQTQGLDHADAATGLNNLAQLLQKKKKYDQAEPLFQKTLAVYEKTLGPDHPNVARALNNLAVLYVEMGLFHQAEPLYLRAMGIHEKTLGPDHPNVALDLNNLAGLYTNLGQWAKAEDGYRRSRTIWEKTLGPDHAYVSTNLASLSLLYMAMGQPRKALEPALAAQAIDTKLIDQVMAFSSEDRKLKYLATKQGEMEAFLSLAAGPLHEDPTVVREALNVWLQRKGIILEAQKRFQEALVYSDDPEAAKVLQNLAQVRGRLSILAFGGPGREGPEAYRRQKDELEQQKDDLEARLARISRTFAQQRKKARANAGAVAQALPPGSALIEFARVFRYRFGVPNRESKWLPARYLAFTLFAGPEGRVELLDLGPADALDSSVDQLKKAIPDLKKAKQAEYLAKQLHDQVFGPIEAKLDGRRNLFISPDGPLNLIPFEVLMGPDGRYLIEDYTFNYLASGRDALDFGQPRARSGRPLILGAPDFNMNPAGGPPEQPSSGRSRSSELRGLKFTPLPGTLAEVQAIASILGVQTVDLLTGPLAGEQALRRSDSPRILHLATHGFFLSDQDWRRLVDHGPRDLSPDPSEPPDRIENPLLRSGLALAGANQVLSASDDARSQGLLTAEKVLDLRLQGTDLVVLSACQTGLGEVKNGEGVYGLRRAFVQAGTKGLVMSLWSVPDEETKELMAAFYAHFVEDKMTPKDALRRAALDEMKIVHARHGAAYPLFWGAFIFLGDPGKVE
jgi:tetratricopeptide (TPR) repeat protein